MRLVITFAVMVLATAQTWAAQDIWLSTLDLSQVRQGWGDAQADKSVTQTPLSIAGRKFERGVGTHADSLITIELDGSAQRFTALAGVDDNARNDRASIRFRILGDGKVLWKSDIVKHGEQAKPVDVDLRGVRLLTLIADSAGDGIDFDHADWADARISFTGAAPKIAGAPVEKPQILTPPPPATPRINGPRVFGVRPGSPVLFTIPATGRRPMEFSAENMPAGLSLDARTGMFSGSVAQRGEYVLKLRAKNELGASEREWKLVVGDTLALTPPMGWNDWYCFLDRVTEKNVRDAADVMVSSGMINHGWSYVNIDDCWMVKPGAGGDLGGEARDASGNLVPNRRFGDMKALTDYIHGKGLKAGLYISPGPRTCAGFEGSWKHEEQDAKRFADWGFDFLKYDWCSYGDVAGGDKLEQLQKPYRLMSQHLRQQKRDIVFNLCQYGMGKVSEWGADVGGHCWRTTGDLGATSNLAASMMSIGFGQNGLEKWAGPGHWNDPDYLLMGVIWWGGRMQPTPLTPNEQYTYVSLWSLLAAPLFISNDMAKLDEFTLSLLTNDEVIDVDQDPLGRQGRRVAKAEDAEVWAKPMEDGTLAVGLFNRGEMEAKVTARWTDLGIQGPRIVRDLWRQKDLGEFKDTFEATVRRHGVVLVRLRGK